MKPVETAPQAAAQPDGWRSPFATTSNYEHNQSWTAPVPSRFAPPPPVLTPVPAPPTEPTAPVPLEAAVVVDDATPVFAGWPNFSTSTIPAEEPTQPGSQETPETALAAAPAMPNLESEAPGAPAIDGPHVVQAPSSEPDSAFVAVEEPVVDETAAVAPMIAEPVAVDAPEALQNSETAPSPEPEIESPIAEEPAAASASAPEMPVDSLTRPEVGEDPADNPTEPIPVMTAIAKSDIVQRALGLVDELRNLIPSLRSTSGPANPGDAVAILKETGAGLADSDDLTRLRAALETAAARPRDIDVMMDLVSRAGAIQELLAERDKYAAAITHAQAALEAAPE